MTERRIVESGSSRVRLHRNAVLLTALAFTAWLLYVAEVTFGTDDVIAFATFAQDIHQHGPIGVYGRHSTPLPYNHPPLTGYWLELINWVTAPGRPKPLTFPFYIRTPAILSGVITALLVFELVRVRRELWKATVAGLLAVASPVLLMVSGFHGNTDPVFVMLTVLSFYLLVTYQRPWAAGVAGLAIAAALSVKLVPVVTVPLLMYLALRNGRRPLVWFLGASGGLMAVLWLPVVLLRFAEFKTNVLDYAGVEPRQWGLVQLGAWLGLRGGFTEALVGPGRYVVLLLAAGLPVLLVWRRPTAVLPALGLALSTFLLLSPAGAVQYLAWPAAVAALISIRAAVLYHLAGTWFLLEVYSRWNRAPFWDWYHASASLWTPYEINLAMLVWVALLVLVAAGLWQFRRPSQETATAAAEVAAGTANEGEADGDAPSRAPLVAQPAGGEPAR